MTSFLCKSLTGLSLLSFVMPILLYLNKSIVVVVAQMLPTRNTRAHTIAARGKRIVGSKSNGHFQFSRKCLMDPLDGGGLYLRFRSFRSELFGCNETTRSGRSL